jgi:hypothetical protein
MWITKADAFLFEAHCRGIIFVYLISPPFYINKKKKKKLKAPPVKMLPLYDVIYLTINRNESLLNGNIESRKVRQAIRKGYK